MDDYQRDAERLRKTASSAEKLAKRYAKAGDAQEAAARTAESKRLLEQASVKDKGKPASKSARKPVKKVTKKKARR